MVIGALLMFAWAQFLSTVVLIEFKFNQAEIAATLCVEKEVENSCCQGSCVLQKTLKETKAPVDPESEAELVWFEIIAIVNQSSSSSQHLKTLISEIFDTKTPLSKLEMEVPTAPPRTV